MSFLVRLMLRASVAAFVFLAPLTPITAAPPPKAKPTVPAKEESVALPEKVTSVEGVTEYKLKNGVRVLLYPDNSAPKLTVNMVVFVGSRHEGYGETGMAHLLEHMLFKGTPNHPNIPKELRDHGAYGSVHSNADTMLDRTAYYETIPPSDENLEFAIGLEADRLMNTIFKREELVSEMTVVRNEFEKDENNSLGILRQRMFSAAYSWHNYGKDVIGNKSDIERYPIEHLEAFYKKYYRPDNIMVIVGGKFDEEKALSGIAKHFGALKRPERRLEQTYTEEPAQDGEREVVLRRVGEVGAVSVMYHIPALAHPDAVALDALCDILAKEPHGRLYAELVEKKQIEDISGSLVPVRDPGVLRFVAKVDRKKDFQAVRDHMIDLIENAYKTKVTDEELERVKKESAQTMETLMSNAETATLMLGNLAAWGDWRLGFLLRDRTEKVTAEDIARVAEKYLRRSNRTVGLFIPVDQPDRAAIPETPDLAEELKDYKGRTAVKSGEAFEPTAENIEKHVERSVLPSGIKLALLPKQNRGSTVTVEINLQFGSVESLKGKAPALKLLPTMLLSGTKHHSNKEFVDALNRLGAGINIAVGRGELSVIISAKRSELAETLKLVTEVLREPSLSAEDFEIAKNQKIKALEAQLDDPSALAVTAMLRTVPMDRDDIRYTPTLKEAVERLRAVTLEEVIKVYNEQIGGQEGQIAVVGDFDSAAVVPLLTDMFNDWKTSVKYERVPVVYQEVEASRQTIRTPDKANAQYVALHFLKMRTDDSDYRALRLANYILGEGGFSSRLLARVRVKDGLCYGAGSTLAANSQDQSAIFVMEAICNPANIDKVDQAFAEELARAIKDGFSEQEVEDAKKALLESSRAISDAGLAAGLALLLRTDSKWDSEYEDSIAKLTAAEVSAAFRKHIDPKKLVIIEAGDFPNQEAKLTPAK